MRSSESSGVGRRLRYHKTGSEDDPPIESMVVRKTMMKMKRTMNKRVIITRGRCSEDDPPIESMVVRKTMMKMKRTMNKRVIITRGRCEARVIIIRAEAEF
ncbi:unnamed protein product [Trifolium pratense]|uniref:Uncharacterized protein n=1 Tax=Trifolium pratense TaxID=57577 RepID=A0ACB0MBW2_TRIPR|nr:unnamed protein product [Trifolium pratense]